MADLHLKHTKEDNSQKSSSDVVDYIDSHQLLGKTGRVHIRHRGEVYQLRQTQAGKLILTK
ncbi:hemin uptake protein HemP [Moellerella wisconsensis]|uniref:Hemin uptake protein HemP n=2 Tax=Moellerella wisconsensis TaxID=158849 RepID=A0ACD3YAV9_9GAMM|nr:hemin uptake protein HemP [Moellerella wisconsensis]KLN97255.1 hypothetical protein VK86_05240 [Moellerella wisconsensis]UNH25367.1 hemin uptake protein HemP [Moellerella wisconsensis]UNH28552.1 hemin uptake protein HemP [Moellerella wisconsensis]UNH32006.1 hemin uptake protein HemP [Moellerella wisconsensis]UNH40115.1 hemin uptake protein HemP [Moellerella wisconsensis]